MIVAKLGLDIHWRGAVTVSQFLRDAGMEVIYLGNKFPDQIVDAAVQEYVDVVGLSTLCGNHRELAPRVVEGLKKRGMGHVKVFLGGVIPPAHVAELKQKGICEVFGPNTPIQKIIDSIRDEVEGAMKASGIQKN